MARKAAFPKLSEVQQNILVEITKRRNSAQHLVKRAKIILLAEKEQNDEQIATQVELCARTVRTWRLRWCKQQEKLKAIEAGIIKADDIETNDNETNDNEAADDKADDTTKALKKYIVEVALADDPYNGIRGKYTPEQIMHLYAIACEHPEESGRPISCWSLRELGDEMVKRGIVERIPITTIWDFLKSSRLEAAQSGRLDESKV